MALKRVSCLSLALLSLISKPVSILWGHSSSPEKGLCGDRSSQQQQHQLSSHLNELLWNWVLLLQLRIQMILSLSNITSQHHKKPQGRTVYPSCSWICDSYELWEINNVHCSLKALKFGGTSQGHYKKTKHQYLWQT